MMGQFQLQSGGLCSTRLYQLNSFSPCDASCVESAQGRFHTTYPQLDRQMMGGRKQEDDGSNVSCKQGDRR